MTRSNVPKFGNWENEDNVPYTVFFDKARKNRGGGKMMINPNDPQENPEMFGKIGPPPVAPAPQPKMRTKADEPVERGAVRPTVSREDDDFRQLSNPRSVNENMGQKSVNESSYGGRVQRPARSARPSAGSELSFERSPLHPHYQPKAGRGNGSPAWEGRNNDISHGTPGRSRLRHVRGDESPDKGAAVPRFGEWNENDPQSAENFTHIFNKVREERNVAGTGNMAGATPNRPSYIRSQPSNEPKASLNKLSLSICVDLLFLQIKT